MLYWLLSLGFTEDQIKEYINKTDYELGQLLKDSNIQIDNTIKRKIRLELYESKRQLKDQF